MRVGQEEPVPIHHDQIRSLAHLDGTHERIRLACESRPKRHAQQTFLRRKCLVEVKTLCRIAVDILPRDSRKEGLARIDVFHREVRAKWQHAKLVAKVGVSVCPANSSSAQPLACPVHVRSGMGWLNRGDNARRRPDG